MYYIGICTQNIYDVYKYSILGNIYEMYNVIIFSFRVEYIV